MKVKSQADAIPHNHYRSLAYIDERAEIHTSSPGGTMAKLARIFAPTAEESRQTLLRIRRRLRFSRAGLAALLGVSLFTLRRWEEGARNPSMAARKLIWLIETMFFAPKRLSHPINIVFWGKTQCERQKTSLFIPLKEFLAREMQEPDDQAEGEPVARPSQA